MSGPTNGATADADGRPGHSRSDSFIEVRKITITSIAPRVTVPKLKIGIEYENKDRDRTEETYKLKYSRDKRTAETTRSA